MQHRKLIAAMAISIVTAVAVPYALIGSAGAAQGQKSGPTGAASSACQTTITKSSGASLETFCIAANGNVVQLAWQGSEQIRTGSFTEGYVLCVGGAVKGYDLADVGESGFQASVITQPGGANTLPLTITRKTTDNTLQLTQTYAAGLDSVSVTATVKNLSAAKINAVKYFRWVDIDAGGTTVNNFTRSTDAVVGNVDGSPGVLFGTATYGQLRTVGIMAFPTYSGGGYSTCTPASSATPATSVDDVAFQSYDLANLGVGISKTSAIVYRRV